MRGHLAVGAEPHMKERPGVETGRYMRDHLGEKTGQRMGDHLAAGMERRMRDHPGVEMEPRMKGHPGVEMEPHLIRELSALPGKGRLTGKRLSMGGLRRSAAAGSRRACC